MTLNASQRDAVNVVLAGKDVWIAGPAGTGKTEALKAAIDALRKERSVLVGAPMAMAATAVDGMTLHRMFGLPVRASMNQGAPRNLPRHLFNADAIAIDEIGALRRDSMDLIGTIVSQIREGRKAKGLRPTQLILCGDFSGLPPVATQRDRAVLEKRYGTSGHLYAFDSPVWSGLETHVLNAPIRQVADPDFAQALELARTGDLRCLPLLDRLADRKWPKDAVALAFTNRSADRLNRSRLELIDGASTVYEGAVSGCATPSGAPAPPFLELKVGARVISVAEWGGIASGLLGTVVWLGKESVGVAFDGDARGPVEVTKYSWDALGQALEGEGSAHRHIGSFSQLPLRLAFSLTVHRCRGLEFPEVVVDPRPPRGCPTVPGMLYAALSRCPSSIGVHLTRRIDPSWLKADPRAVRFYSSVVPPLPAYDGGGEGSMSARSPSSMSLGEIQDELHLILRQRPMWGRVYKLISHVERSGVYLEAGYRTFTAWLESEAAREGVSPSLLWHRRSAGRFYEAWAQGHPDAPELGAPAVPQLNEGNLNLARKVAAGDAARADGIIRGLIDGSVAAKDLRVMHAAAKARTGDGVGAIDRVNRLAGKCLVRLEEGVLSVSLSDDPGLMGAVLSALEERLAARARRSSEPMM